MGASSCQEIATKLNRKSIAVADFGDSFPLYSFYGGGNGSS